MKKIIGFFIALFVVKNEAKTQTPWSVVNGKQRFSQGFALPVRDTLNFMAAMDSAAIVLRPQDSSVYYRYKGNWVRLGSGGGGGSYTFSNALTQTGNAVKWGGTLTDPTRVVGVGSNSLEFDSLRNFTVIQGGNPLLYAGQYGTYIRQGGPSNYAQGWASTNEFFYGFEITATTEAGGTSQIITYPDSIAILPSAGNLFIRPLGTSVDTSGLYTIVWDSITGGVKAIRGVGGANILASNGLNKVGNTIKLGGYLTDETTQIIGNSTQDFRIDSVGIIQLNTYSPYGDGLGYGNFYFSPNQSNTYNKSDDGTGNAQIQTVANNNAWPAPSRVRLSAYQAETDGSEIDVNSDSIKISPSNGTLNINSLPVNTDTTGFKPLKYNPTTGRVEAYNGTVGVGNLQTVTDAGNTTTNNIKVVGSGQYVTAYSLTGNSGGAAIGTDVSGSGVVTIQNQGSDNIGYIKADSISGGSVRTLQLPDVSGVPIMKVNGVSPNNKTGAIVIPTSGGGGGGKVYYFNGGVSMGTFAGIPMYELGDTAVIASGVNFTRSTTGNIANFITDVNKPNLPLIPAGVWTVDVFMSETGGGSNHAEVYAILEVWNGTTLTAISTSPVEQITNGSTIDLYTFAISVPNTPINLTDRIVIQFYIQNANGKTVTLYTQDGNVGEVHSTFTTGIGSINGLTAPSQILTTGLAGSTFNITSSGSTHTFNLPYASSTNTGLITNVAQNIGGAKTFLVNPYIPAATYVTPADLVGIDVTGQVGRVSPSNARNVIGALAVSDTSAMLGSYVRNVAQLNDTTIRVTKGNGATNDIAFRAAKDRYKLGFNNISDYVVVGGSGVQNFGEGTRGMFVAFDSTTALYRTVGSNYVFNVRVITHEQFGGLANNIGLRVIYSSNGGSVAANNIGLGQFIGQTGTNFAIQVRTFTVTIPKVNAGFPVNFFKFEVIMERTLAGNTSVIGSEVEFSQ